MNREDIIHMAREAELPVAWICDGGILDWADLKRFAALVAAAEREECAKVLDEMAAQDKHSNYYVVAARAIRARSKS